MLAVSVKVDVTRTTVSVGTVLPLLTAPKNSLPTPSFASRRRSVRSGSSVTMRLGNSESVAAKLMLCDAKLESDVAA